MQLMGNIVQYVLNGLWDAFTTPFYYHLGHYASFWAVASNLEEYAPMYAIIVVSMFLVYLAFFRADSVGEGMLRNFAPIATLRSIARAPLLSLIGALHLGLRLLRHFFNGR
jgi:hypothetical protein